MAKINLVGNIPDGQIFTVTVVNHSEWALLKQGKFQVFSGNELDIPIDFLYGSDYTCVAVTNPHTLGQSGIHTAPITADTTIHISDTKYRVEVLNEDTEGVEVEFPPYKFATPNTEVVFNLTYASGCDSTTENWGTNVGLTAGGNSVRVLAQKLRSYCKITKKTHTVNFVDEVAWTSTESKVYENVRHKGSITIPVSYRDSASYSYLKTLEGYQVGSSGIVVPSVTEDTRVTAEENIVQIKTKSETNIATISPALRYVNFNTNSQFTLSVSPPFTTSDLSVDKGTISGNTLTLQTTYNPYESITVRDTLTYTKIGQDETYNSRFPINSNYKYSQSQIIYTADEIRRSGRIRAIGFYAKDEYSSSRTIRIYLGTTDSTEYSTTTDYKTFTSYNFYNSVTLKAGWNIFPLSSSTFTYNGSSNLVIMVNDSTGNYNGSTDFSVFSTGSKYQTAYLYSDSTSYSPSTQYTYYRSNYKPMLRLNFG
jgi:hypothetical protein